MGPVAESSPPATRYVAYTSLLLVSTCLVCVRHPLVSFVVQCFNVSAARLPPEACSWSRQLCCVLGFLCCSATPYDCRSSALTAAAGVCKAAQQPPCAHGCFRSSFLSCLLGRCCVAGWLLLLTDCLLLLDLLACCLCFARTGAVAARQLPAGAQPSPQVLWRPFLRHTPLEGVLGSHQKMLHSSCSS